MEKNMKKYNTPEIKTIELDQLDVITTSGMDTDALEGGAVNKGQSGWTGPF